MPNRATIIAPIARHGSEMLATSETALSARNAMLYHIIAGDRKGALAAVREMNQRAASELKEYGYWNRLNDTTASPEFEAALKAHFAKVAQAFRSIAEHELASKAIKEIQQNEGDMTAIGLVHRVTDEFEKSSGKRMELPKEYRQFVDDSITI